MLGKLLISNLLLFTFMNCQTQANLQNDSNSKAETSVDNASDLIYLKEGQNIFLKAQQANITFVGITEDSRCPEGVNCIWAGAATATITVMTTTSRPMQIQLSTMDMASRNLTKSQNIGDYHITLVKVTPYPNEKNSKSDMKGKYQIALKIEKGNIAVAKPATSVTTK